ncbi:MAG TPA: UDP-N-acetylmuramoyl-L-alanine--D-glutamate ligase [Cyclobacteriaceae bacterium]|nr:UDP-N-acetylmuramoyl-L-alanine--D-glutamate ligase [Cyclobacteriaceae bacterium]
MKENIVILGGGESGTGAALLAKAKGMDVFVSDSGQLKEKYKTELIQHAIEFEEGQHTEERILKATLVIKSPGIPGKTDLIKKIKAKKIAVIDEIEFAFRYIKGKVIAITGTNGKTTTTLMTYHLLKSADKKVALAGNVGESLARKVAVEDHDWYVLEVSSFQLDGTQTFHPHIGVLLNITPDHLDRYNHKMANYINSKFRLTKNMGSKDYFIYFVDDPISGPEAKQRSTEAYRVEISLDHEAITSAHFDGKKMVFQFGKKSFKIAQQDTTLKGTHNLINTMAAVSAAYLAKVPDSKIREGLKTFKNAPHRLEPIAEINGVEFVNDSKATNVDSVVYALGSYDKPLIWIAGGIDKGNDYNLIKNEVAKKVKTLICLGKDNEKLKKFFGKVVPSVLETQSVKELVSLALQSSQKGDVVLLSPACASFDLFKNYEDRGNQFREAVLQLKNEVEGVNA